MTSSLPTTFIITVTSFSTYTPLTISLGSNLSESPSKLESLLSIPTSSLSTGTTSTTSAAATPTSTSPLSTTLNAPATVTVSATAQPSGETSSPLSSGAKAGIGVGATAGALLLVLFGALLSSIVRRRRHRSPSEQQGMQGEGTVKRQLSREELDGGDSLGHLTSGKEMDGTHWKREIDGTNWRRELEGDRPKVSGLVASGGLVDQGPGIEMA
ncbi:hypothetical protein MMC17_008706 [Xylographa soralifera]|nr:hypothetical protein [Xylographa soralifera]